jgi:threonine dehydrogenase-like Zn-dependent dehydrogenase
LIEPLGIGIGLANKARELEADIVVNGSDQDLAELVMEETSGKGADVVIETAGLPLTFLRL